VNPGRADRPRRRRVAAAPGAVIDLDRRRIEHALPGRTRYKYVAPRVEREGAGWKIVSPNCSRNIDAGGGEIAIACFMPTGAGRWQLLARDHAKGQWLPVADGLTLREALDLVCEDKAREFWR
jgi:hypothetical protein